MNLRGGLERVSVVASWAITVCGLYLVAAGAISRVQGYECIVLAAAGAAGVWLAAVNEPLRAVTRPVGLAAVLTAYAVLAWHADSGPADWVEYAKSAAGGLLAGLIVHWLVRSVVRGLVGTSRYLADGFRQTPNQ